MTGIEQYLLELGPLGVVVFLTISFLRHMRDRDRGFNAALDRNTDALMRIAQELGDDKK